MEKNDECREWIDPRTRMYRQGSRPERDHHHQRTEHHAIIMRLLGRMQTGLKKPRLYIHHLFGLMQFTVQCCFHVICMYVPKCNFVRHRQISGRFPMSHVDLGLFSEGGLRSHVDLGTIGLTGPRSQDDMGQNPRWYTALGSTRTKTSQWGNNSDESNN